MEVFVCVQEFTVYIEVVYTVYEYSTPICLHPCRVLGGIKKRIHDYCAKLKSQDDYCSII